MWLEVIDQHGNGGRQLVMLEMGYYSGYGHNEVISTMVTNDRLSFRQYRREEKRGTGPICWMLNGNLYCEITLLCFSPL